MGEKKPSTRHSRTSLSLTLAKFQAKQARREAQKAAKQDPILKKQIQDVSDLHMAVWH